VAKFYRPERWSDAAILEEHSFCAELLAADIPVIVPLGAAGATLLHVDPFRLCLFARAGGRPPELDNSEQLTVIGRTLGRMHAIGELRSFDHRVQIDVQRLGTSAAEQVLTSNQVPPEMLRPYEATVFPLLEEIEAQFSRASGIKSIRLHGDFHPGNILWGHDDTPHLLDFDDCAMGPAIQDLWMFISGDHQMATQSFASLMNVNWR